MFRYLELRQQILSDFIHQGPNLRLPSRLKLCEKYQVSRTTVDRAVSNLINDGFLYSVPGGGTYVSDVTLGNTSVSYGGINIGVIVPNIIHDTYPGIIRGIQDYMRPRNINVVICNTDNDHEKQHSSIKRMLNSRINGLILVPAILVAEFLPELYLKELQTVKVPLVLCNRSIAGLNTPIVCSNNYYGGYLATAHLIESGYQTIAHLTTIYYQTSAARHHGYLAALWKYGIAFDEKLVRRNSGPINVETGYQMTRELLQEKRDIDAIFCFNDQLACGAINAIQDAGLHVSKNIGVIGYDNTNLCLVPSVKLTSVSFQNYEIGFHAAKQLVSMIVDPAAPIIPETVFCPKIHVRESCLGEGTHQKQKSAHCG